jgi:heme O synthase-like polyprenyltransferase
LGSTAEANLEKVITQINSVINIALSIIGAGVVIFAVYLGFKFFTAEDEGKRKDAKSQLIYAIIGIVVVLALLVLKDVIVTSIGGKNL